MQLVIQSKKPVHNRYKCNCSNGSQKSHCLYFIWKAHSTDFNI